MKPILASGGYKRPLHTPTMSQPLADRAVLNAGFYGPLRNRQRPATESQNSVAAPVVVLFENSCPSAVLGQIPNVVVDSVKRHAVRPFAHIGEKILEDHPSFANRNASATVVFKIGVPRVKTPFLHRRPSLIYRRLSTRGCVPVTSSPFLIHAVTDFHVASPHMRNRTLSLFRAVNAPKDTPSTAVTGLGVVQEHEILHTCSGLNSFVFRHSSHGLIFSLVGWLGKHYNQHENKPETLVAAFKAAGGEIA